MKILNQVGKALLIILCTIAFNIVMDIFLFNEKMITERLGSAIFGGIGGGLVIFFLLNNKKKKQAVKA